MVFGSETPVNIRKNRLIFIIYYAKDTAAYFRFPSRSKWGCSERRGLSAFSTYLTQKHGVFDILRFKETSHETEKKKPNKNKGKVQGCHFSMRYLGISLLSRGPTWTFQPLSSSMSPLMREALRELTSHKYLHPMRTSEE
jgi:hypothetical protein